MKKAWRNPRQVTVHQAPAEPADVERVDRLVALLATGMERLLVQRKTSNPESVDFQANVLHTCTGDQPSKPESV